MKFKSKLRKIGNSLGVIIPREMISGYNLGDEIELSVITKGGNKSGVITEKEKSFFWCKKHQVYNPTCGCEKN